jgi:hypothetical protein
MIFLVLLCDLGHFEYSSLQQVLASIRGFNLSPHQNSYKITVEIFPLGRKYRTWKKGNTYNFVGQPAAMLPAPFPFLQASFARAHPLPFPSCAYIQSSRLSTVWIP